MKLKLYKNDQHILEYLQIEDPIKALNHYPYRYEYNVMKPFSAWNLNEKVFLRAQLIKKPHVQYFGRNKNLGRFEVLYDGVLLQCTIFNRPWVRNLKVNSFINLWARYEGDGKLTIQNYNTTDLKKVEGIKPVYKSTQKITQQAFRNTMEKFFGFYEEKIEDFIPHKLLAEYQLEHKRDALRMIHFPHNDKEITQAVRTLKYEEFLRFQLANQIQRQEDSFEVNYQKEFVEDEVYMLLKTLPFDLTSDQKKSLSEILNDLSSSQPMNRMLQGEVGSGKTIIAALAMYAAYLAGYQTAFMAPTEILAKQQENYLNQLFHHLDINVVCVYSSLNESLKKERIQLIKDGQADMIVGTHSLIQETVSFKRLGLAVVDEQHRFGVQQRLALKDKGDNVEILYMSATPIPRTMANIVFSNMDVSTISQLPKNRLPVKTTIIEKNSMKPFITDLIKFMQKGQQVYVVCPAIEENSDYPMTDVHTIYNSMIELINNRLKLDLKIALLHGKMKNEEQAEIMTAFKDGSIAMLVTTTVVEVGVNIKNANAMIIYDADRFGLSQLHQLRGRVGRGDDQGYCYLLTDRINDEQVRDRLSVIEQYRDGFKIAYEDLRMRGPGEFLGFKQSGVGNFILGDIIKDQKMLEVALNDAIEIMNNQKEVDNKNCIKQMIEEIKANEYKFES